MKLTDEQLSALHEAEAEGPYDLKDVDLYKMGFVYDREYGFFYVSACMHRQVMGLLMAFHHDCKNEKEVAAKLGIEKPHIFLADEYLKRIGGTCYKSSCSECIEAGTKYSLTPSERKFFGEISYLDSMGEIECCKFKYQQGCML